MSQHDFYAKITCDLIDSDADPAEIGRAYQKMLATAPGADRRAQVAKLRDRVAKNMDELAVLRKCDGETRLDSYCRLLEEDALMQSMYALYNDAGRLLG